MVDNRFPSVGVDARFPAPIGTDVRFPAPGTDLEHLPDGTDTRFQGSAYGGAAPSDPAAEVQAILAITDGFAIQPNDLATLWQDVGVTPVTTNAQPIGRAASKWGSSTLTFDQATGANQPAWDSAGAMVFATDDRLLSTAAYAITNAMNGMHLTVRAVTTSLAAAQSFIGFSTSGSTTIRAVWTVNTDGSLTLQARRLNLDGPITVTTAAGLIVANTPFTAQANLDYPGTGIELFLGGVSVATGNFASGGASDATNSNRISIGSNLSLANHWNGKIASIIMARAVLDPTGRASCKALAESFGI